MSGLFFETPLAALVVLAALLPLAALRVVERRGRGVRLALGLPEPGRSGALTLALCFVLVATLLALAAAQPVLRRTGERAVRTDVEAFVLVDVSRSMLAAAGPDAETRFERARVAVLRIRRGIPSVPTGIASLTDRALPHLLPTVDERVFGATLMRALAVDRPPPQNTGRRGTSLAALASVATQGFYPVDLERRLLVVLSDAESQPVDISRLRATLAGAPPLRVFLVRFWHAGERVFTVDGRPEPAYRADPASTAAFEALASAIGARAYGEEDLRTAIADVREAAGSGPSAPRRETRRELRLAMLAAAAALAPLAFVLWRRNRA